MKKQIIIFSILASLVLTGFVLTKNNQPQSKHIYCRLQYDYRKVIIQKSNEKAVILLDDNGNKVTQASYALELMESRGWEYLDSNTPFKGSNVFAIYYTMRKER